MSRCLVLTDPNVIPTVPALAQSLGKHTLQAPGLSSLSSHPAPIWFNVCVIVIALRWKGLASHNAKKKKKVPSLQHEHFLQWRGLCPPHLFTTAGAFFVLEGYFVLPAALSAVTVTTHFSVSLWWCRHTCRHTRQLQSYFIDRLVQNLFIYQRHKWKQQRKFLNFSPMEANRPPSS